MGTKGFWGNNEHFDVIAGRGLRNAPRFGYFLQRK